VLTSTLWIVTPPYPQGFNDTKTKKTPSKSERAFFVFISSEGIGDHHHANPACALIFPVKGFVFWCTPDRANDFRKNVFGKMLEKSDEKQSKKFNEKLSEHPISEVISFAKLLCTNGKLERKYHEIRQNLKFLERKKFG